MIDLLTLALTHGLMAIAAVLLLSRDALDDESAEDGPTGGAAGTAPAKKRGKWQRPQSGTDRAEGG